MKRAWSRKNLWENLPRPAKAAIGAALGRVPPARLLGGKYRRWLRLVRDAERWSAEQAREYQLHRLRAICRLAYERSPYYQRMFRTAGFEPNDLKQPEDIEALPLIDKRIVNKNLASMCTVPPDSPNVDYTSTGGSSGVPLHFYIGADRSAVEYAHLVAGWMRAGYDPRMPQAVLRGKVVEPDAGGLRHEYDPVLRRHYYSNFHMSDRDMSRYLDHISTLGPCFLHVYPSSAATLARFLERSRRPAPTNVRGILAGSENVYPRDRALVERVFGFRMHSWYGHSEKLVLAAECEASTDYHVWPTYGYFELIDENGRTIREPGRRGEIVGTGFINTVMPFIRYRTGDEATYAGQRCAACDREHPVIRDVLGHRTQEMLVARDGGTISWTAINMHDDTFTRVRQFQFRQEKPGEAMLRVVPAEGFSEEDRERMERNLRHKLDGRIDFSVELTDEIPLTGRGKTTYVDQRIRLDERAMESGVKIENEELRIEKAIVPRSGF